MSKIKRNSVRLRDIRDGEYTNVELTSDGLTQYIQLLRRDGVKPHTRYLFAVQWSGTVGDYDYSGALCTLGAVTSIDGSIFISADLYDGYGTEDNPLGGLLRIFDAPLSYYEKQLFVSKSDDVGMSILINVKEQ